MCADWKPVDGFDLEDSAMKAVLSDKNTYVVAGPGAGKTELLAQRASYLLETNTCRPPRKILAISFKKDAAKNLAERVEKRCGKKLSKRFVSFTYDAFSKGLLDRFYRALPLEYRPYFPYEVLTYKKEKSFIKEKLEGFEYNPINTYDNKELINFINSITIQKLPLRINNQEIENALLKLWEIFLHGNSPILTFKMISRLSEYLIRSNSLIKKCLTLTYSHIFLDEFQDTTTIQYDLIKTCFYNSDCILTAVGDIKQRIMVWAGADKRVFNKFEEDFYANKLQLVMNYRCAPNLIKIQKILAQEISGEDTNIKFCKKWEANEGECLILKFNSYKDEAKGLSEIIKDYIQKDKLAPEDICVLVKQKVDIYSPDLIQRLRNIGIKARNEVLFQDLLSEKISNILLDFMKLIFSSSSGAEWLKITSLLKQLHFMDIKDENFNSKMKLIEHNLNNSINNFSIMFYNTRSEEDIKNIFTETINRLGREQIIGLFPQYKQPKYFNDLIENLAYYIWENFELYNDWDKAIDYLKGEDTIPIMTIHKSKGLEYDTVIFLGLEDSAFWSFNTQREEDVRAFFVALSRAKRRVIFTFSQTRKTGRNGALHHQDSSNIKSLYDILEKAGVPRWEYSGSDWIQI